MKPSSRVYVAGHAGLVGSAIVRALETRGYADLVLRSRSDLDLRRQRDVEQFFEETKPDVVVLAAATVGGILANDTYRGDFILDNLQIQTNIIAGARAAGVERLLFLGSSCIYPRDCDQPMREDYLLGGPLEHTNEPYAVAKIAGLKLCEALNHQYGTRYVAVMPTNLYGPNDNFNLETSHVLPALIRKFHEARSEGRDEVVLWGTGTPLREFLHVDDLAAACVHLLEDTDAIELINIGTGSEVTIRGLAEIVARVVGFEGRIVQDLTKPDGTPRKLLDVSRLRELGWTAGISLPEGIRSTYEWFLANVAD